MRVTESSLVLRRCVYATRVAFTPRVPDSLDILITWHLFARARFAYGDAYRDVLRQIPEDLVLSHRAQLLYPDPHATP